MGSTCPCSDENDGYDISTQPARFNERWMKSVIEGNIVGCKFIHLEDPDVIDQIVDTKKKNVQYI